MAGISSFPAPPLTHWRKPAHRSSRPSTATGDSDDGFLSIVGSAQLRHPSTKSRACQYWSGWNCLGCSGSPVCLRGWERGMSNFPADLPRLASTRSVAEPVWTACLLSSCLPPSACQAGLPAAGLISVSIFAWSPVAQSGQLRVDCCKSCPGGRSPSPSPKVAAGSKEVGGIWSINL